MYQFIQAFWISNHLGRLREINEGLSASRSGKSMEKLILRSSWFLLFRCTFVVAVPLCLSFVKGLVRQFIWHLTTAVMPSSNDLNFDVLNFTHEFSRENLYRLARKICYQKIGSSSYWRELGHHEKICNSNASLFFGLFSHLLAFCHFSPDLYNVLYVSIKRVLELTTSVIVSHTSKTLATTGPRWMPLTFVDYCSSDYVHTIFILCSNYFHTMYILFSYYFHSMFILFQRLKHECLKSLKHYRNRALLRPKKVAANTAWMMSMKVNSYHCKKDFSERHFRGVLRVLHHFCWDSLLSNSDPRSHGSDQWTSRAVGHCHGHVGLSLANPRDTNRAQWVSHCRVDSEHSGWLFRSCRSVVADVCCK